MPFPTALVLFFVLAPDVPTHESAQRRVRLLVGPPPPQAVDVPLVLWTNPTWPNGLPLGTTNGVSWGDYDADGFDDFFSALSRELWRNLDGQDWKLFTITEIPDQFRYGSSFGDYNDDGLPDIGTEPRDNALDPWMHLLRNLGGGPNFDNVADLIIDDRPFGDTETMCWADVDHDGYLDCFLPAYPAWDDGPGNFFLHNLGPKMGGVYRFTEISAAAGLDNPPDSARPEGAEWCDVDFDGDLEMYAGGTLYQNHSRPGTPLFLSMSEAASGIVNSSTADEGCCLFDADMDGDFDLGIAYCLGHFGVRIYENLGDGMFLLLPPGIIDEHDTGNCLGYSKVDWDNDGDIDITTAHVFRKNNLVETGDLHYSVATHNLPAEHIDLATPAWADWDLDGDQDCCLGNYSQPGHFYENTSYDSATPEDERRYLRVRVLRDSEVVPAGLETEYGASVEIHVPGETLRRRSFVTSSGGYLNQNQYSVHFGMPGDPAPDDDDVDVPFDLSVDFVSDPAVGLLRIDRWVNPELGNLDLADLSDRQISVFRSGKVIIDGCEYPPLLSGAMLTTSTGGLALPTDTVPLPDLSDAPTGDWYVGIDFDTVNATGPLLIKEIIFDGRLRKEVDCGAGPVKMAIWDVTDPTNPFLVDSLAPEKRRRNRRHFVRTATRVDANRHYRLVVGVKELRASPIAGPVTTGAVTVNGGLSFDDPAPCSGSGVVAAVADPTQVYAAIRFTDHPGDLWIDLGHSNDDANGLASLVGTGELTAGSPVSLTFDGHPSHATTFLVLGADTACIEIGAGDLIPTPDHISVVTADANGDWTLTSTWPPGIPAGTSVYVQTLFFSATAPDGLAASNAVSATTNF